MSERLGVRRAADEFLPAVVELAKSFGIRLSLVFFRIQNSNPKLQTPDAERFDHLNLEF